MVNRDIWDSAAGLGRPAKGDKILQAKIAERERLELAKQRKLVEVRSIAERMRKAHAEKGILNRLKGFFIGTTINGKPHGSAILRKDLFARFKRGKR